MLRQSSFNVPLKLRPLLPPVAWACSSGALSLCVLRLLSGSPVGAPSISLAPIPSTLSLRRAKVSGSLCRMLPPRAMSYTIALSVVLNGLASNGPGIEVLAIRSPVLKRRS